MERQEDVGTWFEDLSEEVRTYAEHSKDYYVFVATERLSRTAAGAVQGTILLVVAAMMLMLMSIAGALWLGHVLGDHALGFLCIAALYLLLGLGFWYYWRRRGRARFIVDLMNSMHEND